MKTTGILYPNMYITLVGAPGVGKSRVIARARKYLETLQGTEMTQGLRIAPTSVTSASLVDALVQAKRTLISWRETAVEFHSMILLPDEWGAFTSKFDDDLISNLTTFYDVVIPYSQTRRHLETKIVIPRPQLNIIGGATPSFLLKYVPEHAWDQGFTSRMVLIYDGTKQEPENDFAKERQDRPLSKDMVRDLASIFALGGEFRVSQEFADKATDWRRHGEHPKPRHPRLEHYNTRRRAHLYKLAMVASVDRDNNLDVLGEDFHRAISWLEDAELRMENIFDIGATSPDARAMDEIIDFVRREGPVGKGRVLWFASRRLPQYAVYRCLDILVHAGQLKLDDNGIFTAIDGK